MNRLNQGHSRTALQTSRNAYGTNPEAKEDNSQGDPHPEAGIFQGQMTRKSDPEDGHDMVTGVHEEVAYYPLSTSSGEQKKNRSTSQPQFGSENTPTTIEANQTLSALQQLANNTISTHFHNKINRISNLPKSPTTTMPTFDGKSVKFELFEDLFQTRLKTHNQLTEDDRITYFQSFMKVDALQTFKNIISPTQNNLGEILAVFRRKYLIPQKMVTVKHIFQKLVINPAN